jgi:hypothetical protein
MADLGRTARDIAMTAGAVIGGLAAPVADVARTASYTTDNAVVDTVAAFADQVDSDLAAVGISDDVGDLIDAQEVRDEQRFDEAMSDLLADGTGEVETTQEVAAEAVDFADVAESADLGEGDVHPGDAADFGDVGGDGGSW